MDINIVWIIAVLLLATGAVKGFRKGLVEVWCVSLLM